MALSTPFLHAQVSASPAFSSSRPDAPPAPANVADATLPDDPSSTQQQTQQPTPAQQTVTPTPPPPANARQEAVPAQQAPGDAAQRKAEGDREVKQQEKQRVGGVLPLFNVVISGQTVPLTPAQKFSISLHTIVDPYTIGLAVVVGGGFGEIEDSHPGYHWGPEGLFKRIGASYADNAIGNVVGNAALPVLLHQDPRYYRKGEGSVISRIVYSALTTFVCYGDNGKKQFNYSNIGGNVIAGAISNAYYPSDERGLSLTLQNAATVTYEGMLGAQILEFSPDFEDYLHRRRERHRQALAAQQAAAQGNATPAPGPTVPSSTPAAQHPQP